MNRRPAVHEQEIIRSWHVNAEPWTRAIQTASIASRRLVTDRAIIEAIQSVKPHRVFDLECREPTAPNAIVPASVIFSCKVVAR